MPKKLYNPNAFLRHVRNVNPGLETRTKILSTLEKKSANITSIAEEAKITYGAVLHHLRLLEAEKIILRKGKKPYVWELTGAGQRRLTNMGKET